MKYLENIDINRNTSVSRSKLLIALQWLKANNPLYQEVIVDMQAHLDERDFIRLSNQLPESQLYEEPEVKIEYTSVGSYSRIIRASWHQGNPVINIMIHK